MSFTLARHFVNSYWYWQIPFSRSIIEYGVVALNQWLHCRNIFLHLVNVIPYEVVIFLPKLLHHISSRGLIMHWHVQILFTIYGGYWYLMSIWTYGSLSIWLWTYDPRICPCDSSVHPTLVSKYLRAHNVDRWNVDAPLVACPSYLHKRIDQSIHKCLQRESNKYFAYYKSTLAWNTEW